MPEQRKTMKLNYKWLWLIVLSAMAYTFTALAQTNLPPVTDPATPAPLPTTLLNYWELAIAGITPLIVSGIWWLAPKIPSVVIPLTTPFVGIGLGLLMNWLGKANLSWVDMGTAGALAVFVRETVNQAITKRLQTPPAK